MCQEKEPPNEKDEERLAESTVTFTNNLNDAALKVFGEKAEKRLNLFSSPFSLQSALGMLSLGSKGKTREQILRNLFPSFQQEEDPSDPEVIPEEDAHRSILHLTNRIFMQSNTVKFNIANRVYLENDFNILSEFKDDTAMCYLAEAANVDFKQNPEKTRIEINDWVKNQTMDKIDKLLPKGSLTSNTRFVLVNAIYFFGTWKYQFDTRNTTKVGFTILGESSNASPSTVEVDMMSQTGNFTYCEPRGIDAKVLQMNYAGDKLSMIIVLPDKSDGVHEVHENMGEFNYSECIKGFRGMRVTEIPIQIPKFEIKSEYKMKEVLSEMGIKDVFNEKSNLSGISKGTSLAVDEVYHQAYIKVNEEGTEAAAATAVGGVVMSAKPKFFCTHPFMFMIVENKFGTILFEGKVMDPTKVVG